MITEAINILAKREDLYNCLIKAEIFKELEKNYPRVKLEKLLVDRKNGTWGEDYIEGGIKVKVLRSQDIRHGFIDYEKAEVRYVSKVDFEKNELVDGDILVIKSNGSEDLVGKSQIFYSNQEDTIIPSNFLMRIRANQHLILPDYLDLFLKSPQALKWRVDKQSTTTGLRNLDSQGYVSVDVPLPTLEQQKNIVANYILFIKGDFSKKTIFDITRIERFKNICDAISNISIEFNQQQTYLQLLRQTILQEAVQGKLSEPGLSRLNDFADEEKKYGKLWNAPAKELLAHIKIEKEKSDQSHKSKKSAVQTITEDEIPFELPEGWVWCRLGEIVLKSEAGKSLVCEKRPAEINEWGIIKVSAMSWGKFKENENKVLPKGVQPFVEYKILEGDYLISRANTEELIGKSVIVGKIDSNLLLSDKSIRIRFSDLVSTHYVNFYNNSTIAREYYISVASGTSDSMKNITRDQMYMLPFPLPPLAEQHRIVAKVQQLQQQLSQLEAQVQQSRQYAQQLLQSVLKEAFEEKGKVYEMGEERVWMVAEE